MKIEDKIKEFILTNLYFSEGAIIEDEDSFLETGVVDSTGVMELVAFVETEFGVTVEPDEIVVDNFDSIRKIASFIRRKLSLPDATPVSSQPAMGTPRTALAAQKSRSSIG